MKKIASLLLLPLLLAACGTQNAPQQIAHSPANGMQTGSGNEYVAAFETKVQNDLETLGLGGGLTSQGVVAGRSYLNVLKVNDSTARAYMKTTYPSSTGCTLDWGDGTATSPVTTPSTVSIDKVNHTYTKSGTYTIKLTCGVNVKTSKFTAAVSNIQLGLFDELEGSFSGSTGPGDYEIVELDESSVSDKGFTFERGYGASLYKGHPLGENRKGILFSDFFGAPATKIMRSDGLTFNLKSITALPFSKFSVFLEAYDINDNLIADEEFIRSGDSLETRYLDWNNIKYIKIRNYYFSQFLIDDMSVTINKTECC